MLGLIYGIGISKATLLTRVALLIPMPAASVALRYGGREDCLPLAWAYGGSLRRAAYQKSRGLKSL
jgi:hypothetical protein